MTSPKGTVCRVSLYERGSGSGLERFQKKTQQGILPSPHQTPSKNTHERLASRDGASTSRTHPAVRVHDSRRARQQLEAPTQCGRRKSEVPKSYQKNQTSASFGINRGEGWGAPHTRLWGSETLCARGAVRRAVERRDPKPRVRKNRGRRGARTRSKVYFWVF
jgi:hypothetical protein